MTTIITTMITTTRTTMTTDLSALLRLLSWLSPAFPTGGFAYSHGLEWAVEAGDITNAATLQSWLADLLRHGSGRNDAILLRHAHAACNDAAALNDLAELAAATCAARERHLEAIAQGNAFIEAARPWRDPAWHLPSDIHYAVAVGVLAGHHSIPAEDACAGFLHCFTSNLISAAVRAIPLGQSAGLAVQAALAPMILDITSETRDATCDDLGGACFRADLAAMRHETQYTRLFRS